MTEEIKIRKVVRKVKKVENSEIKTEIVKEPESDTFFKEPLSKDEVIVKTSIENLGISLKNQEVICDFIDCEDKDCSHNGKHNKLKMMRACNIPCGIHKEAKCI